MRICLTGDLHHASLRTGNQAHADRSEIDIAALYTERLREAGLMRALGASGRQLASAQLLELAFSGALAGALAAAGSIAIGWALADQVFRFDYAPRWWVLPGGTVIGAGLALLAGWLSLRSVLRAPPLATLRDA